MLARTPRFASRAIRVRGGATATVLVVAAFGKNWLTAYGLTLPAVLAEVVEIIGTRGHQPSRSRWMSSSWAVAAIALMVIPSWVTTDLIPPMRILVLAATVILWISVAVGLYVDPAWFDPEASSRWWQERLRQLSGTSAVAVAAAVSLTGSWPREAVPAAVLLTAVPLVVGVRIRDYDRVVAQLVLLIRAEGQRGRDQILREIHGALSTQLRQVEQVARGYRLTMPAVYELAVNANSGLRETLTLVDESRDTSTTADTLEAPIRTLTRAEGASVQIRIEVDELSRPDRETARYVLHELVSNALSAGASRLEVGVARRYPYLTVSVTDNTASAVDSTVPVTGRAVSTPDSWRLEESRSAPLAAKLGDLGGDLTRQPAPSPDLGETIVARWVERRGTAGNR
jgi:hypothetical protein